jgi:predicted nucleotidyltransferase
MSAAQVPELDPEALDAVCRSFGLRRVILFGSYATGDPPPDENSDVDVAISGGPASSPTALWECHDALSRLFPGRTLDLVNLADADPLFRWEIMREGVHLWGDELDFLEFRAFAYRDFVDSADLRELERTLFRKKMDHVRTRLRAPSA